MALEILLHALRMVMKNWKQVLHIVAGPAILGFLLAMALSVLGAVQMGAFASEGSQDLPPGFFLGFFVAFIVFFAIVLWIAVAWHRFVLLEEYPRGVLPTFRPDRILSYLWRLIILSVVSVAVVVPLMFASMGMMEQNGALGLLVIGVLMLFVSVVMMRLSLILPAAAIGRPISLTVAWGATRGQWGTMLVLLLLMALLQLAIQLASTVLALVPVIDFVFALVVGLIVAPIVNLSVLTTMYGVYIEKRELT